MNALPILLILAAAQSRNSSTGNLTFGPGTKLPPIPDTETIIVTLRKTLDTLERIDQMKNMSKSFGPIMQLLESTSGSSSDNE